MSYETVEVERVEAETDLAFLLRIEDVVEPVWVPKSVIESPDELNKDDEGVSVEIATWFCRKNDLT